MTTPKLIIGCGYLGKRVALAYLKQGDPVTGVVRTAESAAGLAAGGVPACMLDLDRPQEWPLSTQGCELLYLAPPPSKGVVESRVQRLIAAFRQSGQPKRVVYLSTTGVYGDCQGAWVDERRPANPQVDRARRRWDGEQRFRAWSRESGGELVVLRVAGIYGPDKLPLARLQRGEPMVQESAAPYTNRIHVDDLVQVCLAAMERGGNGEIYNVSDGTPGNMADYFNRVADWAGLPRPPQIGTVDAEAQLSAGMLSYLRESRRLDSRKLQRELGVTLRYPDLASGLEGCR